MCQDFMIKGFLALCFVASSIFLEASLAQEVETGRKELQRLFITERASSQQEKGEWQFNGEFEYRRDNTTDLNQYRIPIALEYGVLDWLELELMIPYVWQKQEDKNNDSIGNLKLELVFLLLKGDEKIPYIAAGLEGGFPTAEKDENIVGEEDEYAYGPFINMTKYLPYFIVDLNLSYNQSRNDEVEDEIEYNLGVDFLLDKIFKKPFFNGWHVITEFNGESSLGEDENIFYLTPGIKYVTKCGLEFGIGGPIGLVHEADSYRIIGSLTYEFGGKE